MRRFLPDFHFHFLNEARNFRFVRIAHNPGNSLQRGKFLGGALRVAARYDHSRRRILLANSANGLARLQVRRSRHGAGIDHHHVRGIGIGGSCVAALQQLPLDGRGICLRRPAPELFDKKSRHLHSGFVSFAAQHAIYGLQRNMPHFVIPSEARNLSVFRLHEKKE